MREVLLKELSNSDIDWMLTTGSKDEIAPGQVLIRQGKPVDALYILLDGELIVSLAQSEDNPLGRAFAALEGGELTGREIARLSSGDMVGEIPFLEAYLPSTTVKAVTKSLVLAIPRQKLATKLQADVSFAAHLYRASAILLSDRLQQIINQLGNSTLVMSQPQLREILFIFAELRDSDIDWLIVAGSVSKITAGAVLIQGGRPVEALHILLEGKLTLAASEDDRNPLARAFSSLENVASSEKEFARLSRGDIVGETPFIEAPPPSFSVKAVEDSWVLSIPQWRLAAKLLHDLAFASRFYRVLAVLLADKQRGIVSRLGYGRLSYGKGQALDGSTQYENELSADFLAQVALAGARFDWMLKRIRRS
ncbi:MAG: cyclic nucleotide-binding domain-containing protein [Goleter apudmare HA4340-LM2]|jgi:bacteriocin-type transport-associated protein|nr:cyclic nucleotide-binding domain-containing protein [Goleter apudmare HA4340-LM2]